MPFTAAKLGAVQGSVIVVGGWQEAKLSRPWIAVSRASRLSGLICRFCASRMNNALHGREAWRGPCERDRGRQGAARRDVFSIPAYAPLLEVFFLNRTILSKPWGEASVGAVLKDILQQKIVVTENGKTRRIPALEVMLRRLANGAMRSDPNAIRLLLPLTDRYSDSPEAFNAKNVTGTVVILPSNGRENLERKPE